MADPAPAPAFAHAHGAGGAIGGSAHGPCASVAEYQFIPLIHIFIHISIKQR
jgi:hypothetical protein